VITGMGRVPEGCRNQQMLPVGGTTSTAAGFRTDSRAKRCKQRGQQCLIS